MNMLVSSAAITTAPSIAIAGPDDDRQLLDLEKQILEAHDAAMAYDEDIWRCVNAWHDELHRLRAEVLAGRSNLTADERWQLVRQMPESAEQTRLAGLQEPHFTRMDKLIKEMSAMTAHTPEGRRAKVEVLLTCVMPSDWRESDDDADYEIEEARKLLIEFVGGEPGKRLQDQFAAGPIAAAAPAAMPSFDVQPETSHPDAEIIELGREFERLLSVELSLEKEKNRLDEEANRIRCRNMGLDPNNQQACLAAGIERRDEWVKGWEAAATDVGYHDAWKVWNKASSRSGRIGKKIFKIAPTTMAGLLVRMRVIETHDEIFDVEPADMLFGEVRAFAKRLTLAG
jgi:hypothetical protein